MTVLQVLKKKRVYIPAVLIVLYTITGFFILPAWLKGTLAQQLFQTLDRPVTIEKVRMNPFALTLDIDALQIEGKQTDVLLSCEHIRVDLSTASLFKLAPVISQVLVESPTIGLVRKKDGSFNISDLLVSNSADPSIGTKPEQEKADRIPGFMFENIRMTDGRVVFEDKAVGTTHRIDGFMFNLPFISSFEEDKEKKCVLDVKFTANKTQIAIEGTARPFVERPEGTVKLRTGDIDLLHYLKYVPVPEGLSVKSAGANLSLTAEAAMKPSAPLVVLQGNVNVLNADVAGQDKKTLAKFEALKVVLAPSKILEGEINLTRAALIKPFADIIMEKSGQINLLAYLPGEKEKGPDTAVSNSSKKEGDTAPRLTVQVETAEIREGNIQFADHSVPDSFSTAVSPVDVTVKQLKLAEALSGQYEVSLKTQKGIKLDTSGCFATTPVEVSGDLSVSGIDLPQYAPYYNAQIPFDLASGKVGSRMNYQFKYEKETPDLKLDISDFTVAALTLLDRSSKDQMVNIPEVSIRKANIDLAQRRINTGTIQTGGAEILVLRDKTGQINLAPPAKDANEPVETVSAQAGPGVEPAQDLWNITVNNVKMSNSVVDFHDRTNEDPVHIKLSDISIEAADLKTYESGPGSVAFKAKWNDKGDIDIHGKFDPANLSGTLDLALDRLDIQSVQPYFTDSVRILVTKGWFNTNGKLKLDLTHQPEIQTAYTGEASITEFVSLDKKSAKDFFKCDSLFLEQVAIELFPVKVDIHEISLTQFYSRIFISDKGELNLATIFNADKTAAGSEEPETVQTKAEQAGSPPPQIKLDSVTLQGGHINFSDYMAQPNFTASMKDLAGSVTGLSSKEGTRAKMHLKGFHGQSSPLDISGNINPLAQKKYIDLNISFQDIELSNFTPYSSRFLGYKIEKGKLILDLEYLIDGKKLNSENRVRLDNLTLGERVESNEATNLPIGLAISLLKNSDDVIDLDLPVKGELDDPEFKIGSIILKMLGNLVVKVVTSPFSIIGSMFGGGEDLGYLDFAYGSGKLDETGADKLDTLAKILLDKPSVNLDIQGGYDANKDTMALKMIAWDQLLKAEKLKLMVAQGSDAESLEDISLTEEEIPGLIDLAYEQAQFLKPKEDSGEEKVLDVEEKKKLLITHILISPDELRLLAMERSNAIKDYLVTSGKVEKERIFLLEPKETGDIKEDTVRVTFILK